MEKVVVYCGIIKRQTNNKMTNSRGLTSKELAQFNIDIVKEISLNSVYSIEEASAIWGGAPVYLETIHNYSKGQTVNQLAINVLNKLKL